MRARAFLHEAENEANHRHRVGARILFCLFLMVLVGGCEQPNTKVSEPTAGDRIKVVASIYPLADFVRAVGGDRVEVVTLLPPAASPHVYSPSPRDLARFRGAVLFVQIGLGFEFWSAQLARAGAGEDLIEVETSEGVDVIHETGHDGAHGHAMGNPHIWLDPIIAMHQVRAIRDALAGLDPDHREIYFRNAAAYLGDLEGLDEEIREAVNGFARKSFVAIHPSWTYFAERYGLFEAGVIEPSPGREPTPVEMMKIVRQVRESSAKVVFAEPQLNPKAAHVLAKEVGAQVLTLDPIGSPDVEERSTYLKLMRYNLDVMRRGMQAP